MIRYNTYVKLATGYNGTWLCLINSALHKTFVTLVALRYIIPIAHSFSCFPCRPRQIGPVGKTSAKLGPFTVY